MAAEQQRVTPYGNIRVLDMSRVLAGPWAGQILADLGADVIKVERPVRGDDARHWGPPFLTDREGHATEEAAYFLCANRGKRSITVDISRSEGQKLIRALAAQCDVLIENYKVGDLARFGLSYDDLKAVNPELIYCSVTGFGQTGPLRKLVGYDFMIQATGGLMSLTGHGDAEPGGGPMKVGVPVADLMTGMYAAVAIQGALARRARSGGGEWIDLALLDCQVAMLANQGQNFLSGDGSLTPRMGNSHPNVAPYEVFPTMDGHIVLAVGTDNQYQKFCASVERPDLAEDPAYRSNGDRIRNRRTLSARITEIIGQQPTEAWLSIFGAVGVPCGSIHTLDQVYDHPQLRHREMLMQMDHPLAGAVRMTANPIRYREQPIACDRAPPTLGQHTQEVLAAMLNLSPEEIRRLADAQIV